MANYFLNNDGSLTKSKKKKNKNYILNSDGTISLMNSATQNSKIEQPNNSTPLTVSPKLNLQEKKEAYNTALNKSVLENEKQLNQELKNRGYNSLNPILPYSQKDRLSKNSEIEKENRLNVQNELLPIFQNVRKNTEEVRENLNQASNDLKLAQYQYDVDRVNNEKTTFFDKTVGNIIRASADMGSIFTAGSNKYVDENGNTIYLPSYNDLKQQKVREDYDTGIGRLLGDVAYNSTKILASTGLNVIAPGAGSTLYWSDMFTDNLENAKSQGYGDINSIAYAITGTGMEYLTGKFLGSATKGLTGGQASTLEQALNKGFNKIVNNKTISNVLSQAGSEGVEEFLQEYLENLNKVVMLDEEPSKVLDVLLDTDILGDALYSAAVGAISGEALSFVNGESNNDVNTILKQQLEQKYKETKDTSQKAKIKEAIDLIDKQNEPITVQELVEQKRNNQNNTRLPIRQDLSIEESIQDNVINHNENEVSTNAYQNIGEAMYDYANKIKNNFETNIEIETNKSKVPIDYSSQSQTTIFNKAKTVFSKIGKNVFKNNGENIYVSNSDIKESIAKTVRNTEQKKLLAEHIEVFENLDKIIENGEIIARGNEMKGRSQFQNWDYYATPIILNGENYIVEFDTVLRDNGQKHFRLERIYSLDEAIKKQDVPTGKIENQSVNRFVEQPVSINNDSTILDNSQIMPSNNINMQNIQNNTNSNQENIKLPTRKTLNPTEISSLIEEDANTTPILPYAKVSTGKGESNFANNIENKTNMLNEDSKSAILSDYDVKYYQEVTNQESLNKAFERLNKDGKSETERWFRQEAENADSTDVAEGWILLKQYQDQISNTNDIATKDELNRSMVQVAKKLRDMGTKAGQTVQAFNILNRLTPEGMVYYAQSELSEAYQQMVKNKSKEWIDKYKNDFELTPQETQFILDTMQEVSKMSDDYNKKVKLAEIQKIMTDKLPPEKGAGIKAWMRISMLFNPKTQVRNVVGNALIAPVNSFSDLIGSVIDRGLAKTTNVRTTGTTSFKNYGKGFKKGLFESYNDFKKGINTRNIQGNRFEINQGKSFNNNTSIGKALNRVDSLLSFMLDAGDRGFYEASFVNSINNQLVLNNTTEVTQDMIDIATTEALQRTWQDNNNYTRFVMNVRKMMNMGREYGLGDILIPFAKTPANLTKAIVDYSPLGLINSINKGIKFKRSLTNGQFTPQLQHDFVQTLGKATAGSLLYIVGYALAKAGITSGESDDDKDVSNFLRNTLGINSYSIKIGDRSFTYDWAQPLAAPLAITANIVQKEKEDQSLVENIISSLDTAGSILLEQSFMDSLNTVFNNNDGVVTGLQEAILELPSRAMPTFFKQIADMVDGTQRTSFEYNKPLETAVNKVKAKIPFLSQTLSPSVDTLGRDIQKYGGNNNIFNVFLNPANVSTENISESAGEIYRLYKETGNTNIMPRVAPYYINKNGEKITLNSSERAQYQKASGNIIEKEIEKLLNNSQYNKMSDEKKSEVISDIVNYSYNIAQKEVLGTELSDTYQKVYEYGQIGDISDYYAFRNSVDDTDNDTKKESITNYLLNSTLSDKELAALYGSYYSSEETLEDMMTLNIPIKEYIKLDSQEFTTDYDRNGKAITNSKKNKIINYVNSLNLSIPQKAMLIKTEYSSYDSYDTQIINYVNNMNYTKFEKASLLKQFGINNYDDYIINYINSLNITLQKKTEMLEDLGFTVRNGRVYS